MGTTGNTLGVVEAMTPLRMANTIQTAPAGFSMINGRTAKIQNAENTSAAPMIPAEKHIE
jgi:hypothetical protein